jgi:hypothetical protein
MMVPVGRARGRRLRLLEKIGGSAWESNPPTAFSRRHIEFKVLGNIFPGFSCSDNFLDNLN